MTRLHLTRRELVASLVATGAVAAVPPAWAKQLLPAKRGIGPGAFNDGVASGEPSPTAVTFWSRLETSRPRSGARLVVATDPGLRHVVAHTIVPTGRGVNGALKARIGGLQPYTEYYYVWESGTGVSPIGRTRTALPPGSAAPVLLGSSSCQQFGGGYYNVHADAAALSNLDLYLFLGDYIYEAKARKDALRDDEISAVDLATYRAKYALYRSDPNLRELHRLHPCLAIWDDHEVENNYSDNNPAPALAQRWAGYRANFEWLPRMSPRGDRHRVYRQFSYGNVDIFLTDERQYRTGSNDGQPRHMLGEPQMTWLIDAIKASRATWKIVMNEVVMAKVDYGNGLNSDAWDGYPDDRARLLGEIERAAIDNVIFLTGDAHIFMCNLLSSDFSTFGDGTTRKPAGVEYVTGSVTSRNAKDFSEADIQAQSPWNREFNAAAHGYGRVGLAPDQATIDYMVSNIDVPGAPTTLLEHFTQPVGTNTVQRQSYATARV
jgi:alkaline phosphatase D